MEQLSTAGPTRRWDLYEDISLSRSTITRAVDSLEEVGWLTDEVGTVRLTPIGQFVIAELLALVTSMETAQDLSPFLDWFRLGEYDLEVEDLCGGTITAIGEGDPHAPTRIQTELIQTTSRFRALFPSLDLEGTKLAHERMLNGEFEAEIVVPPEIETMICSEQFARFYGDMCETGRLIIHVTDEVPFYLGLDDDARTQIGVEDDDGFPRALFETTNRTVRSWGEALFSDYCRSASRQLTNISL
jgi:DNA-binding MarR family transcriptional regulator